MWLNLNHKHPSPTKYRVTVHLPPDDATPQEIEQARQAQQIIKLFNRVVNEAFPERVQKLLLQEMKKGVLRDLHVTAPAGKTGSELVQECKNLGFIPQSATLASWDTL